MRLALSWRAHSTYQQYCLDCLVRVKKDTTEFFTCARGHRNKSRLVIDPKMVWWIADDGEYWHESAGVFVRDRAGRFLFIERTVHPVGQFTVPAGHVDTGESAERAARRELREETGLRAWRWPMRTRRLRHIASEDIIGDSCRRGSDAHRWHAYLLLPDHNSPKVRLSGEGRNPQWLTLAEARTKALTRPVRHMIDLYGDALERREPRVRSSGRRGRGSAA